MFEKRSKNIKYKTYFSEQTEIRQQVLIQKELAETVNLIRAVFKDNIYGLNISNSAVLNMALKYYLDYLNTLSEDDALESLKNNYLNTIGAI